MNFYTYIPKYEKLPAQLHCYIDIKWSTFDRLIQAIPMFDEALFMVEWDDDEGAQP